jgi:RimK family alpha-L-glutamate ligase
VKSSPQRLGSRRTPPEPFTAVSPPGDRPDTQHRTNLVHHADIVSILLFSRRAKDPDEGLVAAARRLGLDAAVVTPSEAMSRVHPGDLVVNRLDVSSSLDGVEAGLGGLRRLEHRGIRVVNTARAQRAAHDKLVTALHLHRAGIPHPDTRYLSVDAPSPLAPPLVVKPRFGSWGRDVFRCRDTEELARCLGLVRRRPWFRKHGALVQPLLPGEGRDLRILVAGSAVVGAVERMAAAGEWRTNVSLGAARHPIVPSEPACAVAIEAVAALRIDFACVDVLFLPDGRPVVLEVNGAPDFTAAYSLDGSDVFEAVVQAFESLSHTRPSSRSTQPGSDRDPPDRAGVSSA